MISLEDFIEFAKQTPAEANRPKPYLQDHLLRFYQTYREVCGRLPHGSRLISVGAGRAYVECALSHFHKVSVSVFDFPEAIERNSDQYKAFKFEKFSGNFLDTSFSDLRVNPFNGLLFCEIVEHIPLPPAQQFRRLAKFVRPGGFLCTTTPNIASASRIARLLRGKNIIAPAEALFSPVSAANESIHRREYTLPEITDSLEEAGMKVTTARYIHQRKPSRRGSSLGAFALTSTVPRLRPMMLAVGEMPVESIDILTGQSQHQKPETRQET